jgi:hypothetical protein
MTAQTRLSSGVRDSLSHRCNAAELWRCSVRLSRGARRMPLGACGMATCYGFAWRTCALDADALVGAAVGGGVGGGAGVGGGVGPAGGVQVTCIPRDVVSPRDIVWCLVSNRVQRAAA